MKKRLSGLSILLASTGMIAIALASISIDHVVSASESTDYTAIGSVVVSEDDDVTYATLSGWASGFYKNEKLYLDGLSFDFYFDGFANGGLGFTFSPNTPSADLNSDFHAPTVSFWNRAGLFGPGCDGQLGLYLNDNHDYSAGSTKLRVSKDSEDSSFGYDKCIVAGMGDSLNGIHIEYAKEDENWWSITISALEGMETFSSFGANPNLTDETIKLYISQENFASAMDSDGKAYLRVFDVASNANVYVTNVVNGNPYAKLAWSTINGDPSREKATKIENGYSFDGVSSGALVSNDLVYVDGLEFDLETDAVANANSYAVGLSFVQNKDYVGGENQDTTNGTTICLNRNAGGSGQDRLSIVDRHVDCDWFGGNAISYKSMDDANPSGLSDAGGIVATHNAANPTKAHYKFEKINSDWWKVTITGPDSYFWGSNNYNLNNENNEVYSYIKNSDFTVDEYGGAYLAIQFRGSGSLQNAKLTCVKNGKKIENIVHPESVSLSQSEATIDAGDTLKLVATVLPEESTNKTINWTSSDDAIATVNKNGLVSGVASGEATITASTVDGGFVASCVVNVVALDVSDKWAVANGDPAREIGYKSTTNGGYKVQVGGPGADLYYTDKVTLDGFSFDFGNKYQSCQTDSAFYFSTSSEQSASKLTFTLEHYYRNGATQTRLCVNMGGYSDTATAAYIYNNLDGGKGLSQASSLVFNSLASDETINVKFEHVEYSWWKVTISEVEANKGQFLWQGVNYNVFDNDGKTAAFFYIYADDLDIDEAGSAYLHLRNENSTITTMTVANIVDGTYKEIEEPAATEAQINTVKAKIDDLSLAGYDTIEASDYEELKIEALAKCDVAGVKFSELNAIYSKLTNDIRNAHNAKAFAAESIAFGEVNDETANFVDQWGQGVKTLRLNDEGGVMLNLTTAYGVRGRFASSYDISNVEISIDFSSMTTGNIGALAFGTSVCPYVSPDSEKLFSFDFYKYGDGEYTVTLAGATQDHNLSVEGFSNGTSHHPAYSGRIVNVFSDILVISITTDYETGKTIVSINDQQVELDSAILYGNTLTEKLEGNIALGAFGNNSNEYIRVNYVKDAASIETAKKVADAKEAMDAKFEALKASATEALNDETYLTYKDGLDIAINEIEALIIAEPTNENVYLAKYAAKLIAELELPVSAYQEALSAAKVTAASELIAYFNEDLYDDEGYDSCQAAIMSANKEINAATSLSDVASKLASGKAAIDAVTTKAAKEAAKEALEKAIADAKTNGTKDVNDYLASIDKSNYSKDNQAVIDSLIEKALADINAASDVDSVTTIINKVKADVEAIEQKKGCFGSVGATSAIGGMLSLIALALLKKRKEND